MTKPTDRPSLRLYWPETLVQGSQVELSQDHCHYLFKVMRRGDGDQVGLFNGSDGEYVTTLAPSGKRAGFAHIGQQIMAPTTSPKGDLTLYFAPVKRGPTELMVQKATELGVTALRPILTQHSHGDKLRMDRLESIAVEATEQCERLAPPSLEKPVPLSDLIRQGFAEDHVLVAAEAGESMPLAQHLNTIPTDQNLALVVGPEGGFSPDEFKALKTAANVTCVGLGPRILKAETAAIAGISIIQAIWGDADERPDFRGIASNSDSK